MKPIYTLLLLLVVDTLMVVGDLFAKRAVTSGARSLSSTIGALALWFTACVLWLPLLRARGFTRLFAWANALGLFMTALVGFAFLGERLSVRETAGVCCVVVAILLLGI